MKWQLPDRQVHGLRVQAFVDDKGTFTATVGDETITEDTLKRLDFQLAETVTAARAQIPFVSLAGRIGIMRGFDARSHDILVTWSDGEKSRISQHDRVFPGEMEGAAKIDEITRVRAQLDALTARLQELTTATPDDPASVVKARELFTEGLGVDLFDKAREREAVA